MRKRASKLVIELLISIFFMICIWHMMPIDPWVKLSLFTFFGVAILLFVSFFNEYIPLVYTSVSSSKAWIITISVFILLPSILVGISHYNQSCYLNSFPQDNNITFKINTDIEVKRSGSIGNDLSYNHFINDYQIKNGETMTVNINEPVFIKTRITERDTISDVGETISNPFRFSSNSNYTKTIVKKNNVIVKETGGRRYAGASSEFVVTYTIERVIPPSSNFWTFLFYGTTGLKSIAVTVSFLFAAVLLFAAFVAIKGTRINDAKIAAQRKSIITENEQKKAAAPQKAITQKSQTNENLFHQPKSAIHMRLTPSSSCFSEIGYDLSQRLLIVKFKMNGCVSAYHDVPIGVWNSFISSESLGKWFHANINGKFQCTSPYTSPLPPANEILPASKLCQPEKNPELPQTVEKPPIANSTKPTVISLLTANGIKYIDNRKKGGALWVFGGLELTPFMKECQQKCGVRFTYKATGGKATNGKSAWWAQ